MSIVQILFLLISTLGLLTALGVVLVPNLVRAALYLIGFFFIIACQFVLLEAEFLAVMQVLVYIGAVAILILFGIMLTRNVQGDETTSGPWGWKVPAAVVGLGVLAVLVLGISTEQGRRGAAPWTQTTRIGGINPSYDGPAPTQAAVIHNMPKAVGDELMTRYIIPFEVAGLLLTAALVGAIALARREALDEPTAPEGQPATARTGTTAPSGDGSTAAPATPEPLPSQPAESPSVPR